MNVSAVMQGGARGADRPNRCWERSRGEHEPPCLDLKEFVKYSRTECLTRRSDTDRTPGRNLLEAGATDRGRRRGVSYHSAGGNVCPHGCQEHENISNMWFRHSISTKLIRNVLPSASMNMPRGLRDMNMRPLPTGQERSYR